MNDTVAELLRIRELRERLAGTRQAECNRHLHTCRVEQHRRNRALDRYAARRIAEDAGLFASIRGRAVRPQVLHEIRMKAALMKEREVSLAQQVSEAEKALDRATEAAIKAREGYAKTIRSKEKLAALSHEQGLAREQHALQTEELEIQEIIDRRFVAGI